MADGIAVDKDGAGGLVGIDTAGNVGIGNGHGGLADLGQTDVGRDKYTPAFFMDHGTSIDQDIAFFRIGHELLPVLNSLAGSGDTTADC
jgi:hypothetical protein